METPMGKSLEQHEQWQIESARKVLPLLEDVAKELEALALDMFTPPIAFQTFSIPARTGPTRISRAARTAPRIGATAR